jgi:hypothetical protein
MSKTDTIARMHRDRTLHRILPDGTEQPMQPPEPLAPMTDEAVHAARSVTLTRNRSPTREWPTRAASPAPKRCTLVAREPR